LDNNLGALLRLIDEAEQQESCEVIIAYYVLSNATSASLTTDEIDQQGEIILRTVTGIDIDFDVEDALRDLLGMGIVQFDVDGWKAVGIEEATERTSVSNGYQG